MLKHWWHELRNLDFDALTNKQLFRLLGILIVVIGLALWMVIRVVEPPPPSTITIAAGRPGGAYHSYATRYQKAFADYGITLKVLETSGSVENVERLKAPDGSNKQVDIAFVQSGIVSQADKDSGEIDSVASVFYEPIWVFTRATSQTENLDQLSQLRGQRIAIGAPGSGTRQAALILLAASQLDAKNTQFLELSADAGLAALGKNEVDAVFVVAALNAQVVQGAIQNGYRMMPFAQAEATARQYPWLSRIVLPRGGLNLAEDRPKQDIQLLATSANLAVRSDLHPAIAYLLLDIASDIHKPAGIFQKQAEFPSQQSLEFPQSKESGRYFKTGRPFLQKYLPFWMANLVERLLLVIVPLLAIAIPLLKGIPGFILWRQKAQVHRLYGELRSKETQLSATTMDEAARAHFRTELDAIEAKVNALDLPLQFGKDLYNLRLHLDMLRARLARQDKA